MPLAVKVGRERPVLGIDGDDRADVAVEQALVVVVAELDELVAGAELAARRCAGRWRVRVQRALELLVEVGHAGHPLVHGREHLHVVDRVQPAVVPRDELGAEREHLLQAVLGASRRR